MVIVTLRTALVYVIIIIAMRLMGKRQLGELQPIELVTTILISNIASLPIEDPNLPFITSLIPIFLIASLELLCSSIQMRSRRFSQLVSGKARVVVKNGVIDQRALKELRFGVEDLMEALRYKDVYCLNEVSLAIVETNGQLNVYTAQDGENELPPISVIANGKLRTDAIETAGSTPQEIEGAVKGLGLRVDEILLMQWQAGKPAVLVKKDT